LKRITYPDYEIIVVDNASSGEDVIILTEKHHSSIHLIANQQNYGFPGGCNIGMRYAMQQGTDYLLLLNNDTVMDEMFLDELVKVAESDPAIGIVGSKIYHYYFPNKIQYIGGRINWLFGINGTYVKDEDDHGQYDALTEQDYVPATSCIIKKAVVDKIGYMDPFYFFAIEEFDYCTRAKRAGFKIIYAPRSKVWHKWMASASKLPQFPETQKLILHKVGKGGNKLWYRLYKTYSPPLLFIIPYILQTTLIGYLFVLVYRREWQTIYRGLQRRLTLIFALFFKRS
jgi:GT2 family glycosyltransferase